MSIRRSTWVMLFACCACGGEDVTALVASESQPAPDAPAPPAPALAPLYALATEVFTAEDTLTYVVLVPSLDAGQIDIDRGLEVFDVANIAASEGRLFVSDRGRGRVTRYRVGADASLSEDGAISFTNYGVPDPGTNTFVRADKAYLFDYNTGDHIVWNPTSLEITGSIVAPVQRTGSLEASDAVLRGDTLYRTLSWFDWGNYRTLDDQFLIGLDTQRDQVVSVVGEDRCAGLTRHNGPDETGRVFFSNSVYSVTERLVRGTRESCALRLPPNADKFAADWRLVFAEATGGREAAAFDYLGEGKGLITVFHDERVSIDADTNPEELVWSANWRLWHLDLEARSARPIEELGWLAGGYRTVRVDDEALVMVASEDYAETRAYSISPDGRASLRFTIPGYSSQLIRVR